MVNSSRASGKALPAKTLQKQLSQMSPALLARACEKAHESSGLGKRVNLRMLRLLRHTPPQARDLHSRPPDAPRRQEPQHHRHLHPRRNHHRLLHFQSPRQPAPGSRQARRSPGGTSAQLSHRCQGCAPDSHTATPRLMTCGSMRAYVAVRHRADVAQRRRPSARSRHCHAARRTQARHS